MVTRRCYFESASGPLARQSLQCSRPLVEHRVYVCSAADDRLNYEMTEWLNAMAVQHSISSESTKGRAVIDSKRSRTPLYVQVISLMCAHHSSERRGRG